MSATIDERVVQMEFDNAAFERKAKQTIKTLDKLEQSLDLDGASRSLEEFQRTANSFSLSNLAGNIEKISRGFSLSGIFRIEALKRLTNTAISTGKKITEALTVDPVHSGLEEYETQINAIQTILANTKSKGSTLDDVNAALEELNHYADLTIYNFTEMTRNIGTFTAAGIDLERSVSAIKGIANLGAVSGSKPQQVATAMYQLSQALAAGTVKLQDWNSVVNAGMGGEIFQESLKETARIHGIEVDAMIAKEGSFRESLKHGWITSEVLIETLMKFTGDLNDEQLRSMGYTEQQIKSIQDMAKTAVNAATKVKTFTQLIDVLKETAQSGWTESWQNIIGTFEEAQQTLTNASYVFQNLIQASSDARNEMLSGWKDLGGRTALIESFIASFETLASIVDPIKKAFDEIFPPLTAKRLYDLTVRLRDFIRSMQLTVKQQDKLKRAFKGLFAVLDISGNLIMSIVIPALRLLWAISGQNVNGVLDLSAGVGDLLVSLRDWTKKNDLVKDSLNKGVDKLIYAIKYVKVFYGYMKNSEVVSRIFQSFIEYLTYAGKEIGDFASDSTDFVSNLIEALQNLDFTKFETIVDPIKTFREALKKGKEESNSNLDEVKNKVDEVVKFIIEKFKMIKPEHIAAAGFIGGLAVILKTINQIGNTAESIGGVAKNVSGAVAKMSKAFSKMFNKSGSRTILEIAISIGILAASVKLLSDIELADLLKAGGTIAALGIVLATIERLPLNNSRLSDSAANAVKIVAFSVAMLSFVNAIKEIANVPLTGIGKSFIVIGEILLTMLVISKTLDGFKIRNVKNLLAMVVIGPTLSLFARSLKDLASIDWETIKSSLLGLIAVIGTLALVSLATRSTNWKAIASLTSMAIGLNVLMFALKRLTNFKIDNISQTLKGVLSLVYLMGGVLWASKFAGQNAKQAAKLLGSMSVALGVMVLAFKGLSYLTDNDIEKGIYVATRVYILFGAITALSKFSGENAAKAGRLVISMSLALTLLTGLMAIIGTFQEETIKKGLVVIGAIDLFFSLLMLSAGRISRNKNATKAIGTATVMLISLSGLVALFTILDESKVKQGVIVLGATSLALSALILSISKIQGVNVTVKDIGKIGLLSAIMVALGVLISNFTNTDVDPAGILSVFGAVSLIMATVTGMIIMLSKFANVNSDFAPVFIAVTGLTALAGILGAAFAYIGSEFKDADNLIEISASVSLALLSLSGMMVILSHVDGTTAVKGALALGGAITILTVVFSALGGLIYVIDSLGGEQGTFLSMMDNTVVALDKLGKGLGNFIGSLIKGISTNTLDIIPHIGTVLSQFMENLIPFTDDLNKDKYGQALENAKKVASVIFVFTAANFINSVNSLIPFSRKLKTNDIKKMFKAIGDGYSSFAKSIKDVSVKQEVVDAAVGTAEMLAVLADKMPKEGGLLQYWFGEFKGWGVFAEGLGAFGEAYAAYANSISGVENFNVIEQSAKSAESLAALANALPETGGKLQEWFGENTDLGTFGSNLEAFGDGLSKYSNAVADVDSGLVEKTANAAVALAILANSLPDTNNVLEELFGGGKTTLSEFAGELIAFAVKFVNYSKTIANSDAAVVTKTTAAVNALTALSSLATEIVGDISLSGFGSSLVSFGDQFKEYCDTIADADYARFKDVTDSLTLLRDLCVELVNPSDGLGFLSVKASLYELGNTGLDAFIRSFTDGEQKIIQTGEFVVSTLANAMISAIDQSLPLINAHASIMSLDMTKSIKIGASQGNSIIKESVKETTGTYLSSFDGANLPEEMRRRGVRTVTGFNGGVRSQIPLVEREGTGVSRTFEESVETGIDQADSAESFGAFLQRSIKDLAQEAYNGGLAAGKAIGDGVKDAVTTFEKRTGVPATEAMTKVTEKAKQVYGDAGDEVIHYWEKLGGGDATKEIPKELNDFSEQAEDALSSYSDSWEDAASSTGSSAKKIVDIDNEMLSQEEEYWRTLLRIKRQGADADKYNALSVKEFEQEIFEETLDIWKSYTDRLTSTADSVMNSHNLFEAVSKSEAKSKDELFKNLDDQIEEYRQYAETLATVTFRLGPDSALASYLQGLGVSSLEQLKVINQFTDEELTRYAELYDIKYAYATNIASQQISDFAKETEDKLAELYGTMPGSINLQDFAQNFTGSFETLTAYLNNTVLPLSQQISDTIADMQDGIASGVTDGTSVIGDALGDTMDEVYGVYSQRATEYGEDIGAYTDEGIAKGISDSTAATDAAKDSIDKIKDAYRDQAQIQSPSDLMANEVGLYLTEGVGKGMTSTVAKLYILKSVIEVVNYTAKSLNERRQQFVDAGVNAGRGFAEGFRQTMLDVTSAVASIANGALDAARTTLDEHSPSEKFIQIGRFAMIGFAEGMKKLNTLPGDEMKRASEQSISAAEYAIKSIQNIIKNGSDDNFVIRPIMDLTNIQASAKQLNNLVSSQKGIAVTSNIQQAQQSRELESKKYLSQPFGNNYTFNQYNTSPKSLATIDIYRQTKNQFSMLKEATSI